VMVGEYYNVSKFETPLLFTAACAMICRRSTLLRARDHLYAHPLVNWACARSRRPCTPTRLGCRYRC